MCDAPTVSNGVCAPELSFDFSAGNAQGPGASDGEGGLCSCTTEGYENVSPAFAIFGTWDCSGTTMLVSDIDCQLIDCGALPDDDAFEAPSVVVGTDTLYGASHTMACATGYEGSGDTVTCETTGWSTIDKTLCPKSCGDDPVMSTGFILEAGGHLEDDSRTVTCDDSVGYVGNGDSITCRFAGWDTVNEGTCTLVDCDAPDDDAFTFGTGDTTFGESLSVECTGGGTTMDIECQLDGSWTDVTLCCDFPDTTGYTIASGGNQLGDTRDVTCSSGYDGSDFTIECLANNVWEDLAGCSRLQCATVEVDTYHFGNDEVNQDNTDFYYGDTLVYACANGYTGDAGVVTCQVDGTWNVDNLNPCEAQAEFVEVVETVTNTITVADGDGKGGSSLIIILVIVLALLAVVGILLFIFFKRRKKNELDSLLADPETMHLLWKTLQKMADEEEEEERKTHAQLKGMARWRSATRRMIRNTRKQKKREAQEQELEGLSEEEAEKVNQRHVAEAIIKYNRIHKWKTLHKKAHITIQDVKEQDNVVAIDVDEKKESQDLPPLKSKPAPGGDYAILPGSMG
jgi:flagellar basal body-associated protein FliL